MDFPARRIAAYRAALLAPHRVRTSGEGLRFITALGFCYAFTAGPGNLPGLFDVLATRSIDRMWGWAWRWKDDLVTARRVYYGKVLRGKPAYVSLGFLPHFYALSGNVGDADDAEQAYREGRLSRMARDVYQAIDRDGPLSTWMLRRRFVSRGSPAGMFQRALTALQSAFLIAKVAEIENGAYSFIWDAFARWMPQAVRAARTVTAAAAAGAVLERYLKTVGAASPRQILDLFRWSPTLLADARAATNSGAVEATVEGMPVLAHRSLHR